VAYIYHIFVTMKVSIEKHHKQVSKVFQLLMDNHKCDEIGKCLFNAMDVRCVSSIVCGLGQCIDRENGKVIVNWPWTTY